MPDDQQPTAADETPHSPEAADEDLTTQTVEHQGQKLVPLAVASRAREKRAEAKAEAEALRKENDALKAWQDYGTKAQPIIDLLKSRPDVIEALQQAPAAKTTPADEASEELAELAKTLDLYDAAGRPDVARAKTVRALVERTATKLVDEKIQPLATRHAATAADSNLQKVSALKGTRGQTIDRKYLDAFWQAASKESPEMLSDPQSAMVTALAAAGYQYLYGDEPPVVEAAPNEPLYTEPAGGGKRAVHLTDLQTKVAKDIGQAADEFQKNIQTVINAGGILE